MSGYASHDDAFDPKYGDPIPVPIVMATKETLKGYGTIVTDFDATKVEITPWPVKGIDASVESTLIIKCSNQCIEDSHLYLPHNTKVYEKYRHNYLRLNCVPNVGSVDGVNSHTCK